MGAPAWFSAPDQGQGRGKNEGRETIWVGPERRFVPPRRGMQRRNVFLCAFRGSHGPAGGGGAAGGRPDLLRAPGLWLEEGVVGTAASPRALPCPCSPIPCPSCPVNKLESSRFQQSGREQARADTLKGERNRSWPWRVPCSVLHSAPQLWFWENVRGSPQPPTSASPAVQQRVSCAAGALTHRSAVC